MKKEIKIFKKILSPIGFSYINKFFYNKNKEVTVSVNIQKSNYSDDHYINIGIWMNALGGETINPKIHMCHIMFRADSLLLNNDLGIDVGKTLNFNEENIQDRINSLKDFSRLLFAPLISKFLSLELIAEAYKSGCLSNALLDADAREFLNRKILLKTHNTSNF